MTTRMLRLWPCLAALLTLGLPALTRAVGSVTFNVPSAAYPTIQSGVDAATVYKGRPVRVTVLVADGPYSGPGNRDIDFHGNNITVTSQNGPTKTVIDCGGSASTDGSSNHRGFYIHSGETNAVISGFTIKNGYQTYGPNEAGSAQGGGIYVHNSQALVQNCILIGNTARDEGGGIYAENAGSGTTTIINCNFVGNIALDNGGGIATENDGNVYIDLTNCTFTANTASYDGGGVFNINNGNGTTTLTNCILNGNIAQSYGGGVFNENYQGNGMIDLINCSLNSNAANFSGQNSGGGIYDENENDGGIITLTNDILYGDIGGEVRYDATTTSSEVVSYSDVQGGYPGTNNINLDPQFVNAAAGDLHLRLGSPCLGKGTPNGAPTTDKDGNPRPNPPSMGAYELGAGQSTRAVLLVHGTFSSASTWNGGMSQTLKSHGFIVEATDFPTEPETKSNEARIEDQASALKRRISELITRSGQPSVDLVCHSMGGLAARYYLEHQELWQTDQQGKPFSGVSKLVMLGTPNWGTDSPLLDPVATVSLAHHATLPKLANGESGAHDQYDNWGPAISEQFAEWEPAPEMDRPGHYYYPSGDRLYSWDLAGGSFSSPIQGVSYLFANFVSDTVGIFGNDYYAEKAVLRKFPESHRQRNPAHLAYYPQAAQKLGVDYPSNQGVHGVNKRLVSRFLYDLNQHPIVPGVEFYLIAGNKPLAESFPYFDRQVVVPGPFSQAMENDGVVPTQSAFGLDPLTGQPLFNTIHSYTINTYHLDLPNNSEVIGHVLDWLSQ